MFVEAGPAWGYAKVFKNDARKLFNQIFMECVPEVVLALPFISCGGRTGTVGIPKDITEAVCCK